MVWWLMVRRAGSGCRARSRSAPSRWRGRRRWCATAGVADRQPCTMVSAPGVTGTALPSRRNPRCGTRWSGAAELHRDDERPFGIERRIGALPQTIAARDADALRRRYPGGPPPSSLPTTYGVKSDDIAGCCSHSLARSAPHFGSASPKARGRGTPPPLRDHRSSDRDLRKRRPSACPTRCRSQGITVGPPTRTMRDSSLLCARQAGAGRPRSRLHERQGQGLKLRLAERQFRSIGLPSCSNVPARRPAACGLGAGELDLGLFRPPA